MNSQASLESKKLEAWSVGNTYYLNNFEKGNGVTDTLAEEGYIKKAFNYKEQILLDVIKSISLSLRG